MSIQAIYSHGCLVLYDICVPALGCLSNLHWWIPRLPPTSCHYKWCHHEQLQTHPLMGLLRYPWEIHVRFILIWLRCVSLLSRKAAPGNTPNSSTEIHPKPRAFWSFLIWNPWILSHSPISTVLLLSITASAFISHPAPHGCYLSLVFSESSARSSGLLLPHGFYWFLKQWCLLVSLSFCFTFKHPDGPLVIIQSGTLLWSQCFPWATPLMTAIGSDIYLWSNQMSPACWWSHGINPVDL